MFHSSAKILSIFLLPLFVCIMSFFCIQYTFAVHHTTGLKHKQRNTRLYFIRKSHSHCTVITVSLYKVSMIRVVLCRKKWRTQSVWSTLHSIKLNSSTRLLRSEKLYCLHVILRSQINYYFNWSCVILNVIISDNVDGGFKHFF